MTVQIIQGDALTVLKTLPDESVNCCVTSPPYWGLRDYGVEGQLGLERTPEEYVAKMVEVFREVRRVLRDDGTLWLNLGDSYAGSWGNAGGQNRGNGTQRPITSGSMVKDQDKRNGDFVPPGKYGFRELRIKPKDLVGIPWAVAFALRADGWYLRQDIIWHKPNPMPESVTDRCTKAHEYIFLMSKSQRYHFDQNAIKEPSSLKTNLRISKSEVDRIRKERDSGANTSVGSGRSSAKVHEIDGMVKANKSFENAVCLPVEDRNKRSVWTVTTAPFPEAHFATFPPKLIEPCILAGCPNHICAECRTPWVDSKPSCKCNTLKTLGGTVLDPFGGSGTVGMVAEQNGRNSILIELNPKYVEMAKRRTSQQGLFGGLAN